MMVTGKQKISAYAPSDVVRALAALESTTLKLSDSSTQAAMVHLVKTMRQSVGVGSRGDLDMAISAILFSASLTDDETAKRNK